MQSSPKSSFNWIINYTRLIPSPATVTPVLSHLLYCCLDTSSPQNRHTEATWAPAARHRLCSRWVDFISTVMTWNHKATCLQGNLTFTWARLLSYLLRPFLQDKLWGSDADDRRLHEGSCLQVWEDQRFNESCSGAGVPHTQANFADASHGHALHRGYVTIPLLPLVLQNNVAGPTVAWQRNLKTETSKVSLKGKHTADYPFSASVNCKFFSTLANTLDQGVIKDNHSENTKAVE